jgi:DNA repair exonuclease SbcCD ATPase subunit
MASSFTPLGPHSLDSDNGGAFWPSFTDIMMVVVLIFLLATSLLIVRNWQLVSELQQSIDAERAASEMIETTSLENATLEERLINAEQLNSILRLRVLEKEELLNKAEQQALQRQRTISGLEANVARLDQQARNRQADLQQARQRISAVTAESEEFANQLAELRLQLAQQKQLTEVARTEAELAAAEIAALNASFEQQQQSIDLLEEEKAEYNRQLLTLKGDYEVVRSKYEQLVKPARSAQGKYVAEVYYNKQGSDENIRFKEPGDEVFTNLTLAQVEQRLDVLKQVKGQDLYVKIIIPEDSGLTYNEAWDFMRKLLQKYDYYYQGDEQDQNDDQESAAE